MTHTSALKDNFGGPAVRPSLDPARVLNAVSDFAVITLDHEGNIISWNVGAERIYGWHSSEVLNRHFSMLYSSDAQLRGRPFQDLKIAANSGHSADQVRCRMKDGTYILCRVAIDAIAGETDEDRNFVLTARDISQFMAAEAALKTQEERYRALIEASSAMVWRAAPNGMIIDGSLGWIRSQAPPWETFGSMLGWMPFIPMIGNA